MKLYVGITDDAWFAHLAAIKASEVNFWRPSARQAFRALSPGEVFLFKLHAPQSFIVGGGVFSRYVALPLSFAWSVFGEENGAPDFSSLRQRVLSHRPSGEAGVSDPRIGCIVLCGVFFWPREDWLKAPTDWPSHTQVGKTYDADTVQGRRLWHDVQERIELSTDREPLEAVGLPDRPVGRRTTVFVRQGQGAFRLDVIEAYGRRCAVTGERALPAVQAAHIRPYALRGPHSVTNGLALRADLHLLFDQGYLTVDEEYHLAVSRRLKAEFQNGHEYYAYAGHRLQVPPDPRQRPDPSFLAWHRENVYQA